MKKTIEIQDELERLMDELEKLEAITKINSTNVENVQKLEKSISTIIKSLEEFRKDFEHDVTANAITLDKQIQGLKTHNNLINDSTKKNTEVIKSSFKDVQISIENSYARYDKANSSHYANIKNLLKESEKEIKNTIENMLVKNMSAVDLKFYQISKSLEEGIDTIKSTINSNREEDLNINRKERVTSRIIYVTLLIVNLIVTSVILYKTFVVS